MDTSDINMDPLTKQKTLRVIPDSFSHSGSQKPMTQAGLNGGHGKESAPRLRRPRSLRKPRRPSSSIERASPSAVSAHPPRASDSWTELTSASHVFTLMYFRKLELGHHLHFTDFTAKGWV